MQLLQIVILLYKDLSLLFSRNLFKNFSKIFSIIQVNWDYCFQPLISHPLKIIFVLCTLSLCFKNKVLSSIHIWNAYTTSAQVCFSFTCFPFFLQSCHLFNFRFFNFNTNGRVCSDQENSNIAILYYILKSLICLPNHTTIMVLYV